MSYEYVKSDGGGGGGGDSEPFLSSSAASNSKEKRMVLIFGGLITSYTIAALIVLVVFAFSQQTLIPNLMMVGLIALLYLNSLLLYKWATSADVDDKFKYVLFFGVFILLLANTVGIIYAVSVTGLSCPECLCPSCPCICGQEQFYVNATGQCYNMCNVTELVNFTYYGEDLVVECTSCF